MGKLHLGLAIVGLVACNSKNGTTVDAHLTLIDSTKSIDAKVFDDAPPPMYDFSCLNNSPPAPTAATLTIGGTFTDVSYNGTVQETGISGGSINICNVGTTCMTTDLLDHQTTDSSGNFTSAALTSASPVNAFIHATMTGEVPVDIYPPSPLVATQTGTTVVTFTPTNLGLLELVAGVTQSGSKGILGVVIVDCSTPPQPITGATITVEQGGTAVTGTTSVDGSMFGMGGGAIIFNVPTGTTSVGATFMGMTFRSHNVAIVAGTTVGTGVKPGY